MSRRPSGSELFAWSLVGAGLGLVTGFVLGELLGSSKLRLPRRWGSVRGGSWSRAEKAHPGRPAWPGRPSGTTTNSTTSPSRPWE
jgi:hypothetical protein